MLQSPHCCPDGVQPHCYACFPQTCEAQTQQHCTAIYRKHILCQLIGAGSRVHKPRLAANWNGKLCCSRHAVALVARSTTVMRAFLRLARHRHNSIAQQIIERYHVFAHFATHRPLVRSRLCWLVASLLWVLPSDLCTKHIQCPASISELSHVCTWRKWSGRRIQMSPRWRLPKACHFLR